MTASGAAIGTTEGLTPIGALPLPLSPQFVHRSSCATSLSCVCKRQPAPAHTSVPPLLPPAPTFAGTPDWPITICGPEEAVLQATGRCERAPYGLLLDGSSHIRLVGFTISEGQKGGGQLPAPHCCCLFVLAQREGWGGWRRQGKGRMVGGVVVAASCRAWLCVLQKRDC